MGVVAQQRLGAQIPDLDAQLEDPHQHIAVKLNKNAADSGGLRSCPSQRNGEGCTLAGYGASHHLATVTLDDALNVGQTHACT